MSIAQNHDGLSDRELEALEALEERLGRGTAVKWDEPKTIKGYLVRPIEEAEVPEYGDSTKTVAKKLATVRTATGLQAIWEGPAALDKLFEIKGSGMPVIVAYLGEKVGQESGRTYKAFDVVVGEAPTTERATGEPSVESGARADDDIPW
jgi:hypothetical protein